MTSLGIVLMAAVCVNEKVERLAGDCVSERVGSMEVTTSEDVPVAPMVPLVATARPIRETVMMCLKRAIFAILAELRTLLSSDVRKIVVTRSGHRSAGRSRTDKVVARCCDGVSVERMLYDNDWLMLQRRTVWKM